MNRHSANKIEDKKGTQATARQISDGTEHDSFLTRSTN